MKKGDSPVELYKNEAGYETKNTTQTNQIDPDVVQRKAIEAQVQAQAGDKRFVSQMATTPNKEALPLQKKQ